MGRDQAIRLTVRGFTPGLWESLRPDWESLLEQRSDASAFLSSPWIGTWLEVYGPRLRPDALSWTTPDGQCTAACLVTIRRERRGPFPVRRAYLNATGDPDVASEHNMVLCAPERSNDVHAGLTAHIRRRRADSIMLAGFDGAHMEAVSTPWRGGPMDGFASADRFVPLAELRAAGTPYLSVVSRNAREQIRRSIRLYEAQCGPGTVDVASSVGDAQRAFEELRELHNARWHAQQLPGAFAAQEAARFHATLIERYARGSGGAADFAVEIVRVRFGDTLVGALYNLVYRGRVSFYQSGFQYATDNRLKPGLVTHALAIQHYLDTGAAEYDFLAGEPEAARYKESLGPSVRDLHWMEAPARTPKMWLIERLRDWRARRREREQARQTTEVPAQEPPPR